jgi:hypothetical protein
MEVSLKACQKESNPHTSGWISRNGGEDLPFIGTLRDPTKIGVTIWGKHRSVKNPTIPDSPLTAVTRRDTK